MRQPQRAHRVVQEPDLHAFLGLARQQVQHLAAEAVILEDERQEVDVMAGALHGLEHRLQGGRAFVVEVDGVALREGVGPGAGGDAAHLAVERGGLIDLCRLLRGGRVLDVGGRVAGGQAVLDFVPAFAVKRPVDVLVAEQVEERGPRQRQEEDQQAPRHRGGGVALGHQHPADEDGADDRVEQPQQQRQPRQQVGPGFVREQPGSHEVRPRGERTIPRHAN